MQLEEISGELAGLSEQVAALGRFL